MFAKPEIALGMPPTFCGTATAAPNTAEPLIF
jgi:hypothetical protein